MDAPRTNFLEMLPNQWIALDAIVEFFYDQKTKGLTVTFSKRVRPDHGREGRDPENRRATRHPRSHGRGTLIESPSQPEPVGGVLSIEVSAPGRDAMGPIGPDLDRSGRDIRTAGALNHRGSRPLLFPMQDEGSASCMQS